LGLECGSPNVLRLMRKRFTIEDAEWFINSIHEAGIKIDLNLIVGFPGETEDDFQETLIFISKIAPKIQQIVSVATLNVDHSYLWDHLADYGVVKYPQDRHISWHTADGSNTYPIRVERANRLIQHARNLGIFHLRLDVDIENKERVPSLAYLRFRRKKLLVKHHTKLALERAGLLGPVMKIKSLLGKRK
ncbi:MAG: hypothetical protein NTU88_00960, partial [Armatimonadetes bacterium]|nr:hypothetical protein [Armatimonadota bacterium]